MHFCVVYLHVLEYADIIHLSYIMDCHILTEFFKKAHQQFDLKMLIGWWCYILLDT